MRFSLKGTTFPEQSACLKSTGSSPADRFGLAGSRLRSKKTTFVDDMERVGRYGVAVFSGEEREAMQ